MAHEKQASDKLKGNMYIGTKLTVKGYSAILYSRTETAPAELLIHYVHYVPCNHFEHILKQYDDLALVFFVILLLHSRTENYMISTLNAARTMITNFIPVSQAVQ